MRKLARLGTALGDRIWDARKDKRLSQKDLASILKISHAYCSKLENGYYPSERMLIALAKALDLNEDELFILTGRIPPKYRETLIDLVRKHPSKLPEIFNQINK